MLASSMYSVTCICFAKDLRISLKKIIDAAHGLWFIFGSILQAFCFLLNAWLVYMVASHIKISVYFSYHKHVFYSIRGSNLEHIYPVSTFKVKNRREKDIYILLFKYLCRYSISEYYFQKSRAYCSIAYLQF